MGQKVHPLGFRLGTFKPWLSRWHDDQNYVKLVHEDLAIRKAIQENYEGAGISKVEIERGTGDVTVTIHTARPGIVIGRGGQRVDEVRGMLENLTKKKVHLNIREIRTPDLDAYLVGRNIADQIERRISFRRAIKRAISQTMDAGAKGIKVAVSGRLGGQEIARRVSEHQGSVPLHTLRADIDYAIVEAHTPTGKIGIKVWIYLGDITPEHHAHAAEPAAAAARPVEGASGS